MPQDPDHNPTARKGRIGIHLPGIIRTLGEHLYSEESVAIRELIQNCNDSLIRRQTQDRTCPEDLRIEIQCDFVQDILIIRDNGAGMTRQEITDYLSTVGRSGTDEFRKAVEQHDAEAARRLIGQFGMGFLSAFVIADSVTVRTRSYRRGEPGFTWRCEGGTDYSMAEVPDVPIGTEVVLHLRSEHDEFADDDSIGRFIHRYADFIGFPIYIGETPLPVNVQTGPWHRKASRAEYADYIERRFDEEPLEIIPLSSEDREAELGGVLFIPESRGSDLGVVELYVARMYIGSDHDLLPDWAKFVSGLVETSSLDVTTSRESAVHNAKYLSVQARIADHLARFISNLACDDPKRFNRVIEIHEHAVKIGALKDDRLFELVKDHVQFDSDAGKVTIPEYLERTARRNTGRVRTVYFHTGGIESRQHQLLFAANGIPVLDAEERFDRAFIEKYAKGTRRVRTKPVDQAADALFDSAPHGQLEELIGRYADMEIEAKAVAFKPESVPALLIRNDERGPAELFERLHSDADVPDELRQLFEMLTGRGLRMKGPNWTLCLNANNEVIRLLADLKGHDEVTLQCMKEIYNSAYLVAAKGLSVQEVEKMAEIHTETVAMLLRLARGADR